MGLNDFIHELVHNPKELMRYKQNPARYLEQPGIDLSQEEKAHLLAMHQAIPEEVSTVMRLTHDPDESKVEGRAHAAASNSADETDTVKLDGLEVELLSRAHVFLAEATDGASVECRLLKHSYIHVLSELTAYPATLALNLNLCYIDPVDPHDRPQVLTIRAEPLMPLHIADQPHVVRGKPEGTAVPEYILNVSDVKIKFYADKYVLLRPDEPVVCVLQAGSSYTPSKGCLDLRIAPKLIPIIPLPIPIIPLPTPDV